jgi:hypothetical protein
VQFVVVVFVVVDDHHVPGHHDHCTFHCVP